MNQPVESIDYSTPAGPFFHSFQCFRMSLLLLSLPSDNVHRELQRQSPIDIPRKKNKAKGKKEKIPTYEDKLPSVLHSVFTSINSILCISGTCRRADLHWKSCCLCAGYWLTRNPPGRTPPGSVRKNRLARDIDFTQNADTTCAARHGLPETTIFATS